MSGKRKGEYVGVLGALLLREHVDELVDGEDGNLDSGSGEAGDRALHGVVRTLVVGDDDRFDTQIGNPRAGDLAVDQAIIDVDKLECHGCCSFLEVEVVLVLVLCC